METGKAQPIKGYELTEYSVAKDYGATGTVPEKELVDIANFCMMLYHRLLDNQNCLG